MQEQLDRIEKKLDNMLKLLNPIVAIDKELRADLVHALLGKIDNNYEPRNQPKDKTVWQMCECGHNKGKHTLDGKCTICKKDNCWKRKYKTEENPKYKVCQSCGKNAMLDKEGRYICKCGWEY